MLNDEMMIIHVAYCRTTEGFGLCDCDCVCELKMAAHGKRRENADEDERDVHERASVPQINNNSQSRAGFNVSYYWRLQESLACTVNREQILYRNLTRWSTGPAGTEVRFTAYGCGFRDTIKGLKRGEGEAGTGEGRREGGREGECTRACVRASERPRGSTKGNDKGIQREREKERERERDREAVLREMTKVFKERERERERGIQRERERETARPCSGK